jgi:hypothetical protein
MLLEMASERTVTPEVGVVREVQEAVEPKGEVLRWVDGGSVVSRKKWNRTGQMNSKETEGVKSHRQPRLRANGCEHDLRCHAEPDEIAVYRAGNQTLTILSFLLFP